MLKVSLLLLLFVTAASAQYSTFTLAPTGCPTAHCSKFAGEWVNAAPPSGTPALQVSDGNTGNSGIGLGCVSNGSFVACTYTLPSGSGVCTSINRHNNLVIYSWAGGSNPLVEMYESKCLFDDSANTSVP
jgi:hypothetical protein